jgi:hypothetical protein
MAQAKPDTSDRHVVQFGVGAETAKPPGERETYLTAERALSG